MNAIRSTKNGGGGGGGGGSKEREPKIKDVHLPFTKNSSFILMTNVVFYFATKKEI